MHYPGRCSYVSPVDLGLPHLRNSERAAFKRCPQKWWWSYREGLRPIGQPSNPLWFGTGIHLAFADWYVPGTVRGKDLRETWTKYCEEEVRFIKTEAINGDSTEEKVAEYVEAEELGLIMLNGYLEKYGHDENWDVIAPEQVFAVIIPDGYGEPLIELNGTFDGVYRDLADGNIKLMEHKTAKAISLDHLSLDDQVGTYWAVAAHRLREEGLIGKREVITGITYNVLRKAKPDTRPVGPDGMSHNQPIKKHYLEAFDKYFPPHVAATYSKMTMSAMEELCKEKGIDVFGDVSKTQPAENFVREHVPRTRYEQKVQLERISNEALHMDMMRRGELPLYKTPTRDCDWQCDFFHMCELHESTPDWTDFRDTMFRVEDPYAAHRTRKSA